MSWSKTGIAISQIIVREEEVNDCSLSS